MKVGLGFRPAIKSDIFLHQKEIDFLEITADHYLDAVSAKLAELELLKKHFPLIPHGLNLSLGSAEGVDEIYLEKFAKLVENVDPEWFSDHICFTRSGGIDIGHLSPEQKINQNHLLTTNDVRIKTKTLSFLIFGLIAFLGGYKLTASIVHGRVGAKTI